MITDVFEYNQHFVAMMNVINAARLNPPAKGHKHHIIPKCWFVAHDMQVDNSDDNIVVLSPEDHCKVHKLAAHCIIGSDMKSKMGFACVFLHGSFAGMHHTEEAKKKIGVAAKQRMVGRKLSEEIKVKIGSKSKGRQARLNMPSSEFGNKYQQQFGQIDSKSTHYVKEYRWYKRHGKCRWE